MMERTKLLKVTDGSNGELVMIADVDAVCFFFNLKAAAAERLEHELNETGTCSIHFNGRNERFISIDVKPITVTEVL